MKTCYAIIETRRFCGAETKISLVVDATRSHYLSFSDPEEARSWIRKLMGKKHFLKPNDNASPTYVATKVGSGDFYDAYIRTWETDHPQKRPATNWAVNRKERASLGFDFQGDQ